MTVLTEDHATATLDTDKKGQAAMTNPIPSIVFEDGNCEVHVSRSLIDNSIYVQIDTRENVGNVRVELNDGPLYDGNPETDDAPGKLEEPARTQVRVLDGIRVTPGEVLVAERLVVMLDGSPKRDRRAVEVIVAAIGDGMLKSMLEDVLAVVARPGEEEDKENDR